jgi:aryl-alcohol dehydrogenase-like predicted oxidoreductase
MMFGGPTPENDARAIINRAIELGINFLDTANVYAKGESERIVGNAIRPRRSQVVLATKASAKTGEGPNERGSSRFHLLNELDGSLRRLGTEHIDLWYLHQPDPLTPLSESLRAMDDAVRMGKVRYVGCSNFWAWQMVDGLGISEHNGYLPFVACQPLYNIVNRDVEKELLPACGKHGVGVVSYSPLARGVLTGKYRTDTDFPPESRAARKDPRLWQTELRSESLEVAWKLQPVAQRHGRPLSQFAIAWVLANPLVTSVILGPRTLEQFEDNFGAIDLQLAAEDEAEVDALVAPGEHTQRGYHDPQYPITGRPVAKK